MYVRYVCVVYVYLSAITSLFDVRKVCDAELYILLCRSREALYQQAHRMSAQISVYSHL